MAESSAGQKLKVFISYSRRDSADFADELVFGLELAGFAPFLDRQNVAVGEDWQVRLGRLFQGGGTVVAPGSPQTRETQGGGWGNDKAVAVSQRDPPPFFQSREGR